MKYVSGRVKELKVGISSHSESKTSLTVIGNANVSGSLTAASFVGGGINTTGTSEFTNLDLSGYLNVAGVTTMIGNLTVSNTAPRIILNDTDSNSDFRIQVASGNFRIQDVTNGNANRLSINSGGTATFTNNVNIDGNLNANGNLDVDGHTELDNVNVSGVSTFAGIIDSNGQIVGAATSNIVPFLYSNYSLFPSATTYHGAVAHAHNTGKLYYAHGGNWIELVNKETNGTVGTGTEKYDIGITSVTNLRVAGISTYDGNLDIQSSVLITGITTIGGLVDINAGAQANTLKVEDLTDNRVVIAGTGGELEDDANLTFNGTTFNVGSAITMYQATGIISATSFFGDGSGLENTGSTLSEPSSGTQRLVTTSLTTGTMTSSGTGSELAFDYSNNHLEFTDNTKATFGTGNDLQLYHNATSSYIDNNTGALYIRNNVDDDDGGNIIIQAKSGKTSAVFQDDEGVRLYYDDVEKVATTGYGVTVNGTTETQKLTVTGISTFTGEATFNGSVTLGNDSLADVINAVGRFGSDLVPVSTDDKDLGVSNRRWRTLFVKSIVQGGGGISTFTNDIDVNGNLDVAGVSTFANVDINQGTIDGVNIGVYHRSNANFNYVDIFNDVDINDTTQSSSPTTGALKVDGGVGIVKNLNVGGTITGDGSGLTNLGIPGISTSTTSEFNNLNVTGTTTLATAKVSDLTDNRIVIAGTAGELEDTSKLTFDGTTLAIVGNATFTGNVSVAGTLTSEDKTNIDSIGIVTARTGVRISSGGLVVTSGVSTFTDAIDANGGITATTGTFEDLGGAGRIVFNHTNGTLDDHPSLSYVTGTSTLNSSNLNISSSLVAASAKVSDLTSGRVVYVGTAGELQDLSTFTFNGSTVTAPAFAGDGSALTGITAGGVGAIGGLTVKDEGVVVGTAGSIASLDFLGATVSVVANTGAAGIATITVITEQNQNIQTLNVTGVSTLSGATQVGGDLTIESTNPKLIFTDTNGAPDYNINCEGGKLYFNDSSNNNRILIEVDGHIEIPGNLEVASNITANNINATGIVTATNFNSTSDARLKTNVQTITSPLEKLNQIDGVSFDWVTDLNPTDESSSIGVIADTVEKVLPVLVAEHATGYKTVNYNGLIGLLIEAVKEQQVQITELKTKLDSLS